MFSLHPEANRCRYLTSCGFLGRFRDDMSARRLRLPLLFSAGNSQMHPVGHWVHLAFSGVSQLPLDRSPPPPTRSPRWTTNGRCQHGKACVDTNHPPPKARTYRVSGSPWPAKAILGTGRPGEWRPVRHTQLSGSRQGSPSRGSVARYRADRRRPSVRPRPRAGAHVPSHTGRIDAAALRGDAPITPELHTERPHPPARTTEPHRPARHGLGVQRFRAPSSLSPTA